MREIKFRAWDKSDGQMYYAIEDGIQFDDGSVYEFRNFLTPKEDDYHKWEIMQYTGLKDKNGKEICEGDIIKGDWSITNDIEVGEVSFYGGAFRFKPAGLPLEYGYYRKECEIIGNIYENKDLIK